MSEEQNQKTISGEVVSHLRDIWMQRISRANEKLRTLLLSFSIFMTFFVFTFSNLANNSPKGELDLLRGWLGGSLLLFLLSLSAFAVGLLKEEPQQFEELHSRIVDNADKVNECEKHKAEEEAKDCFRHKQTLAIVGTLFLLLALITLAVPFLTQLYDLSPISPIATMSVIFVLVMIFIIRKRGKTS
ncbi:MAG: hypothetical protein ACLFPU_01150 [Dehalococcoidia bacterium]